MQAALNICAPIQILFVFSQKTHYLQILSCKKSNKPIPQLQKWALLQANIY